ERVYRGDRPPLDVAGRTAMLVDDGIATGSSMLAGVEALLAHRPARTIVAVPVASAPPCPPPPAAGAPGVLAAPLEPFFAIGQLYRDFAQTTDDEVEHLLGALPPS